MDPYNIETIFDQIRIRKVNQQKFEEFVEYIYNKGYNDGMEFIISDVSKQMEKSFGQFLKET